MERGVVMRDIAFEMQYADVFLKLVHYNVLGLSLFIHLFGKDFPQFRPFL